MSHINFDMHNRFQYRDPYNRKYECLTCPLTGNLCPSAGKRRVDSYSAKDPLLSFPTLATGNPKCSQYEYSLPATSLSVMPDVGNGNPECPQYEYPLPATSLSVIPDVGNGNPECPQYEYSAPATSLSVIPDVSNRESRVFPYWTFPSLTVRHHGARDSAVMLALPKGHASRLNPGERLDSR